MYYIKKIRQTCTACPSQWEAQDQDGHMIYIRYRWGHLSIRRSSEPSTDIYDAVLGEEIFHFGSDDPMDGYITLEEVLDLAKDVVQVNQLEKYE